MTFGQRLIELREEQGIFQKELAAQMNVSISTVSNYENDVHYPDVTILCKLADYFHVTIDYLLGRTDYRYDPATLNRRLSKDYNVADYINTTLELSPRDISTVLEYIELLRMRQQNETDLPG